MDSHQLIEQYHSALNSIVKGNSQPLKDMFSHRDDILLANPFGPAVVGRIEALKTLDFAASRFKGGESTSFKALAKHELPEMMILFETESWKATVDETKDMAPFDLRVTSIFRLEDGAWKLILRHADPISTFNAEGPLRKI